jgi:hypothetical protein
LRAIARLSNLPSSNFLIDFRTDGFTRNTHAFVARAPDFRDGTLMWPVYLRSNIINAPPPLIELPLAQHVYMLSSHMLQQVRFGRTALALGVS